MASSAMFVLGAGSVFKGGRCVAYGPRRVVVISPCPDGTYLADGTGIESVRRRRLYAR